MTPRQNPPAEEFDHRKVLDAADVPQHRIGNT